MVKVEIDVKITGVTPLERGRLVDCLSKCVLEVIPRKNDNSVSVSVSGVDDRGKEFGTYGVDISYRGPGTPSKQDYQGPGYVDFRSRPAYADLGDDHK